MQFPGLLLRGRSNAGSWSPRSPLSPTRSASGGNQLTFSGFPLGYKEDRASRRRQLGLTYFLSHLQLLEGPRDA